MEWKNMGSGTISVRAGEVLDKNVGGVTTPIHTATAYMKSEGLEGGYRYPRYGNIPTQTAPGDKIAALEGAEAGLAAASGMAVVSASILAFAGAGDHVVFQDYLYGGTHHFITAELSRLGVDFTLVGSVEAADLEAAVTDKTTVVYVESPTNPDLRVVDLEATADMAKRRGLVSIIDNTFATPINQKPLELGFDVSLHSATKYLNGHSDLNCGAVAAGEEHIRRIRERTVNFGTTLNVYDCFLLERGMKTLALRVARHNENAMALARFLADHPLTAKVNYPGLPDDPGHEIAKRQMSGFGGMLSFELDCSPDRAERILAGLELFQEAVSLGGVESLTCFPAKTSHAKMTREERLRIGVGDTLIRMSAGVEDADDLIRDLERGFETP